ncbi:hypothetical protein TWF730_002954 [Orbilia blumenaviensis]|uniref:Uncharacterized protein n=1 Tax=Orbilia blumenaviensis TaxID=1796055 RepID=A0AAV9U7E7_9PEZI
MKFSTIFVLPLLLIGASALESAAPSDTNAEVARFNHHQGVRAASSYAPTRGIHRRSKHTRRAATKEAKRQNTPSADQIRAAILSLPAVRQLPADTQKFLNTVPPEVWAALPRLTPDQFTVALGQLEKGQLPNIAGAKGTTPASGEPKTPGTQA